VANRVVLLEFAQFGCNHRQQLNESGLTLFSEEYKIDFLPKDDVLESMGYD
jgi:hypothetical protein